MSKDEGKLMQKPLKKVYQPIPVEVERIRKLVLDAAFKFIQSWVLACSNQFIKLR